MKRLSLELPNPVHHTTHLSVRVTDLNYGRHLGHMELIGLVHEARMRLFESLGVEEFDVGGMSLVVTELQASYRHEAFRPQRLRIETEVRPTGRSTVQFRSALMDADGEDRCIGVVHVGCVFIDRATGKVRSLPAVVRSIVGDDR